MRSAASIPQPHSPVQPYAQNNDRCSRYPAAKAGRDWHANANAHLALELSLLLAPAEVDRRRHTKVGGFDRSLRKDVKLLSKYARACKWMAKRAEIRSDRALTIRRRSEEDEEA